MKKTLLLLTISLACIMGHAQKIDKKLLPGKWHLYAMNTLGYHLCSDSMTESIHTMLQSRMIMDPTDGMSTTDSLKLVDYFTVMLGDLFKTYMIYDENGTFKTIFGSEKNKYGGGYTEENGTYEWSEGNKITHNTGKAKPSVFVIVILTTSKLVVKEIGIEGSIEQEMTFTRAK